jgi:hypothetical protein
MFDVYAFLAIFVVQILALSVLHPLWLIRRFRAGMASHPEILEGARRGLAIYRGLNVFAGALGLPLLGWLFSYTRRPDWDDGPIEAWLSVYFLVQMLPIWQYALTLARSHKRLRQSLSSGERRASLQRRGLFDFVSPFVVFLAVLSYLWFVGFAIYLERNPFPGYAGALVNIGLMTMLLAMVAFCAYVVLHARKENPLLTHAERMHAISVVVTLCVCACIAFPLFLSMNFTLVLLDLQNWEPFALSASLIGCSFFGSITVSANTTRDPRAGELGANPVV